MSYCLPDSRCTIDINFCPFDTLCHFMNIGFLLDSKSNKENQLREYIKSELFNLTHFAVKRNIISKNNMTTTR